MNKYTTIRVDRAVYLQFVDRVRRLEGNVSLTSVIMRFIQRYMAETEHLINVPPQESSEVLSLPIKKEVA